MSASRYASLGARSCPCVAVSASPIRAPLIGGSL